MFELFCKKVPCNARVLDVGCGTGLPITSELVKRGFEVTALDISETMIKLVKKNVPGVKSFVQSSITDIGFKNEFDGIVSSFSMLCLDKKNFMKAAAKISQALKRKGFFLLSLNETQLEGHKEEESFIEILGQKMYSRPYSEKEIRDIFEKNNMKIIRIEREIVRTKMYGEEHTMIILFQKG
jgi:SAM-dependent methyltransferase